VIRNLPASARRGWMEKKDVLNTLGYEQLIKRLMPAG